MELREMLQDDSLSAADIAGRLLADCGDRSKAWMLCAGAESSPKLEEVKQILGPTNSVPYAPPLPRLKH